MELYTGLVSFSLIAAACIQIINSQFQINPIQQNCCRLIEMELIKFELAGRQHPSIQLHSDFLPAELKQNSATTAKKFRIESWIGWFGHV